MDESAETCVVGFEVASQVDDQWEQRLNRCASFNQPSIQKLGVSPDGPLMKVFYHLCRCKSV